MKVGYVEVLFVILLGYSPPAWAILIAAAFVLVTLAFSFYLLFEHFSSYKNPEEQKFLIGVILMVPCYAIESFVSLARPSISVDIEILRDCYESFAMYCFGRYLVACLGNYALMPDWPIPESKYQMEVLASPYCVCAQIIACLLWIVSWNYTRPLKHVTQLSKAINWLSSVVLCMIFLAVLSNKNWMYPLGVLMKFYLFIKKKVLDAVASGGEERTVEFMEREGRASSKSPLLDGKGTIEHPFPMNYFLKPWKLGRWFYQVIKIGIVQYMIIKALTSILAVVLEAFGVYCDGEFRWGCGYPYMAVVLNFSQSWALYCLVQFYTITKYELAHIKPLYKFVTFKSIVFLTWWQGVIIALLCYFGLFNSPIAQGLQFQSSVQDFIICIEMCVASIVHLYVFPAKPYELMGDCFPGTISVLGDYVSVDCPVDPDELRDSERPTKLRLPQPDIDIKSGMTITESVRDVVVGGGGYIVKDVKFTVNQAVEPMEKGITRFNEKLHKISQTMRGHEKKRRTKDDSCLSTSLSARRMIKGIDDPLLNGSISDSGVSRGKKQRRKSGYTSGESGGESSSDQSYGGYQIRGRRWITKD